MSDTMSRTTYMTIRANLAGGSFWDNQEAVDATVLAHPEWDKAELKTWDEWEAVA